MSKLTRDPSSGRFRSGTAPRGVKRVRDEDTGRFVENDDRAGLHAWYTHVSERIRKSLDRVSADGAQRLAELDAAVADAFCTVRTIAVRSHHGRPSRTRPKQFAFERSQTLYNAVRNEFSDASRCVPLDAADLQQVWTILHRVSQGYPGRRSAPYADLLLSGTRSSSIGTVQRYSSLPKS